MKISEIGEFGLIDRISKIFNYSNVSDIIGIGDDCAVIKIDNHNAWIVTTDMLIEDRHFHINYISPYELGYKSLAVNLSDIAAMGGIPHSFFISIGIPEKISDVEWIDEFYKGIKSISDKYNTILLGGDTTKSPDRLVINITVLGKINLEKVKTRNNAKVGDLICLTDYIGDSAAGLKVILENIERYDLTQYLINKHNIPEPQIDKGNFLAQYEYVNSMMDVSDGIESDIRRILEQSSVGAEIYVEKLPISDQLVSFCKKYNFNPYDFALFGGEDYCLLFTVENNAFAELNKEYFRKFNENIYTIGKITEKKGILEFKFNGRPYEISGHGFDHFKV